MDVTFKIEGAKEIENSLLQLGRNEAREVGREALRKEAQRLLVAWQERVGDVSGRLKKALAVNVARGGDPKWIFANVWVKKIAEYRQRKTDRRSTVKGKLGPAKYDYQIGTTPEVYGAIDEFGAPGRNIAPKGWLRGVWDVFGGTSSLARIGNDLGEGIEAAANRMRKG